MKTDEDSTDDVLDSSTYQNEITTDTISRAPLHIQPMLRILHDASQKVARMVGDQEINFSVDAFKEKYTQVTAENFYEIKDIVTQISDARCFFLFIKQLPPFPPHKVSTRKDNLYLSFFLVWGCNYITHAFLLTEFTMEATR